MTAGRPLVLPALGFLAGAAIGLTPATPPLWLLPALLLACLPRLGAAGFFAAGWFAAAAAWQGAALPADEPRTPITLEGRLAGVPEPLGTGTRFRLVRPDGTRVEVFGDQSPWPLSLGDRIRVDGHLRAPPRAPNPGGRDRAAALSAAGVRWLVRPTGPMVRIAAPSPAAYVEVARRRFASACTALLPGREAALLRAIGIGDRSALDDDARRSFARSGLAHVLAVSGMHLVVVVYGLWRVLRAGLLRWERLSCWLDPGRCAAAVCLPWAAVYALATGASPPVVRSAITAGTVLLGHLVRREADALNGLALAALVLVAMEPASVLDPSFQLSFAAVAGLTLWAEPLRERIASLLEPRRSRPGRPSWTRRCLIAPLTEGAAATIAASLATMPILAFHFRQLPVLGVPANLAAVPLGAGLTVLATSAAVAAPIHPLAAAPFLWAAWPLAWALRAVSDLAAAPRWGILGVGSPGIWGALGCGALLVVAGRQRGSVRLWAAAAAVAFLLLPPFLRAAAARGRGGLEVLFLSVGQGDAALLRLPDGSAVLVDGGGATGGARDPGERDVLPLLRDLGIGGLAAVIVSHPHPDHVLGLAAVARALRVERVLGNGELGEAATAAVLAPLVPSSWPSGASWSRAGVRFDVVGGDRAGLSDNDASLVVRVTYGETAFLFTGDVERAGEQAAVKRGDLHADVVKVPHHGSRTSSSASFVSAVGARFAVVSVGAANRFGFPHAEAVDRWRSAGAQVLRTDEGAVRFLSDGVEVRHLPADSILDPLATILERP